MTTHIANYLALAKNAEETLTKALHTISKQHTFEHDVVEMCEKFSRWSEQHLDAIKKLSKQFENEEESEETTELSHSVPGKPRIGAFGLLRDLHGLSILIHEAQMCWTVLLQASKALRNSEMETSCEECVAHFKKESMWAMTKVKTAAPQVLVVG
jgi:hypothetical protein